MRTLSVTSVHNCPKCRTDARKEHERLVHMKPEVRELIQRTEHAYADLEQEFNQERQACLAAVARGERPMPAQYKRDLERGIEVQALAPVLPVEERFKQFMEQSARDNAEIAKQIMQQVAILKKRRA